MHTKIHNSENSEAKPYDVCSKLLLAIFTGKKKIIGKIYPLESCASHVWHISLAI